MSLNRSLIDDLNQIKQIVSTLNDRDFVEPLESLSGSSLGQHLRHIIEFYQALVERSDSDLICYDDRKRDKMIETDKDYCLKVIDSLSLKLATIDKNQSVIVVANYSESAGTSVRHASSVSREMGYVLEHSIHHQALIKIGLSELGLQAGARIGVAPATLRFRNSYS